MMGDTDFSGKHSRAMLRDLETCPRITPYHVGNGVLVCRHDFVPLVPFDEHWRHDSRFIARLRETAMEGAWPRG